MRKKDNSGFHAARDSWVIILVLTLCVVMLPIVTHSLIKHPPEYDELLHVLAARGIAETGQPIIEDGRYDRAILYTKLISKVTELHSDELFVARMPALCFAILLVAFIGYWVAKNYGWLAGLVAAVILAITPPTLNLAVLVRFYTLHALLVTVLILLLYEASRRLRDVKFVLTSVLFSALLAWLAYQFHDITIISLGATAAGLGFLTLHFLRHRLMGLSLIQRNPLASLLFLLAFVVMCLAGAWFAGLIDMLRQSTPVWSETRANNYGFYLASLGTQMPLIWPLFPVMIALAIQADLRLSGYLVTIVIVAFIAHSIASQKATRYVYHFYPLICILWGIGFQNLITLTSGAIASKSKLSNSSAAAFLLFLSMFCIVSTQEFRRALKLMLGRPLVNDVVKVNDEADWSLIKPIIDPLLPSVDRVVASSGFKSLYAFGRYSYELHATVVAETDTGQEFGVDHRTGKQVISTPGSVGAVIDLEGKELFIIDNFMINTSYGANSETVELLQERCQPITVPNSSKVTVWNC